MLTQDINFVHLPTLGPLLFQLPGLCLVSWWPREKGQQGLKGEGRRQCSYLQPGPGVPGALRVLPVHAGQCRRPLASFKEIPKHVAKTSVGILANS